MYGYWPWFYSTQNNLIMSSCLPGVLWPQRHNEFFPIHGVVRSYFSNCWTGLTNVSVMFSFYNRITFSIRTSNSNYLLWLQKGVVIHMWLSLWGEWDLWDVIGRRGLGDSKCSWTSDLYIFIKENWICAITRHYADPNNILLTINFPFDSDVS